MSLREAQQHLLQQLQALYDAREAVNIADWVMEHVTGKKKIDRLLVKNDPLAPEQLSSLEKVTRELMQHRPVQYVLGEAWFAGNPYFVNEEVLIPRPETEELVDWMVEEIQKSKIKSQKILDIGTGSGCIPIALKKQLPSSAITSIDKSAGALAVASKNAAHLKADIQLQQLDFLDEASWKGLPVFDFIVSNPPYIKQSEYGNMAKHVTDFEPSMALFVPDEDALVFYRKIGQFAQTHLSASGMLFFEINEALGNATTALLEQQDYQVELKKDLQGKDRMIKAIRV
jgi:release factor glutamine methyltransferase